MLPKPENDAIAANVSEPIGSSHEKYKTTIDFECVE